MVAKKLDYIQDNVRDACLKMYMEACTYKHALAFFQWRERFAPNTDKNILKEIFESRVDYLKEKEEKIQSKISNAEKRQTKNGEQPEDMDDNMSDASTDSLPPPNIERMKQMKKQFAI